MPTAVMPLLGRIAANRDMALAAAVTSIIAMLILPLPAWLLDLGLTLSITLSAMILMTALFIDRPVQLSAFPTILLIATMLRLGLNLASTRLILGHGHEGPQAAGGVIAAFGAFLMEGEPIIGLTIFVILVVINFVVITKGAGRIAEVAARFSLDSMPGKQMAIDADLSAGMINEEQARARRSEVEAESGFYGAMDGASKFVKGDAVAGLMITGVNILVGLLVGILVHGVPAGEAFYTYTLLTVGDGLVTQIPALIVSIAAGLLVSKGSSGGKTGLQLADQLGRYPEAFFVVAGLTGILALLPGLPFVPFALAAGGCFWIGRTLVSGRQTAALAAAETASAAAAAASEEEPISRSLGMDALRIEIGYALLPMVNDTAREPRLDDQVRALRRQLAADYGFLLPSVRIIDNLALKPSEYVIYLRETEVARAELRLDRMLAINPSDEDLGLPGEATREPVFGLPALWIGSELREEAGFRGLTVVDSGTIITTHLTELVKENIADLLTYGELQKLLAELPKDSQKLLGELVPARITLSGFQRLLQNLLAEGISIRDLPAILEAVAEAAALAGNLTLLTEHVRSRLARQISAAHTRDGTIPVITLSPDWEVAFAESIVGDADQRQLAMAPSKLQAFIAALRSSYDRLARDGEIPCLLTSPAIRPFVRSVVERVRPATVVLSQNEIHARSRIRSFGAVA